VDIKKYFLTNIDKLNVEHSGTRRINDYGNVVLYLPVRVHNLTMWICIDEKTHDAIRGNTNFYVVDLINKSNSINLCFFLTSKSIRFFIPIKNTEERTVDCPEITKYSWSAYLDLIPGWIYEHDRGGLSSTGEKLFTKESRHGFKLAVNYLDKQVNIERQKALTCLKNIGLAINAVILRINYRSYGEGHTRLTVRGRIIGENNNELDISIFVGRSTVSDLLYLSCNCERAFSSIFSNTYIYYDKDINEKSTSKLIAHKYVKDLIGSIRSNKERERINKGFEALLEQRLRK